MTAGSTVIRHGEQHRARSSFSCDHRFGADAYHGTIVTDGLERVPAALQALPHGVLKPALFLEL